MIRNCRWRHHLQHAWETLEFCGMSERSGVRLAPVARRCANGSGENVLKVVGATEAATVGEGAFEDPRNPCPGPGSIDTVIDFVIHCVGN